MILGVFAEGADGRQYEGDLTKQGLETIAAIVGCHVPITVCWRVAAGEEKEEAEQEAHAAVGRLYLAGYRIIACKRKLPANVVRRQRKEESPA